MQAATRSARPRVVVFDFDGVLVRGDTFGLFMRDRYAHGGWRKALVLLASPWLLVLLLVSRRRCLRALVHIGLLGVGRARYRALAEGFAAALVHRPHQFYREGIATLRRYLAAGDRVVVVTGCEETLARGVLEGLGVSPVEIVASHLTAGRLGMRSGWHNVGRAKLEALAAYGVEGWQVAYTDSLQDVPLLAVATEAVLVNGSPKLCKQVEKALGRSVTRVEWR
ncbi:MAG: haloacid dehalogenase-like hydrolase [Rhodanobacteraceae bacterium]|nr:MAG: haloacid dehalogenase-like hydrolase [Rhodanobacteraceae bacterium]